MLCQAGAKLLNSFFLHLFIFSLTNQIVCSHNDATGEEYRCGNPVMAAEYHVIDNSFVQQISYFDEAGHSR